VNAATRGDSSDWGGIWLGLAVSSLAAFQMLKLPPALPLMIEDYGYGRVTAGGLVSIYALSGLVLSVAAGGLAARRPDLTVGGSLACFLLGNLVTLALPQIAWLNLLARALEGLAYATFAIAGPAIANRCAAERDLPLVAGIVAIWVPVGQRVALGAGFLVFDAHGWRPLWWLSLALTLALGGWLWLRRATVRRVLTGLAGDARAAMTTARERTILWLSGFVFAVWGGQYIAFMTWLPDYMVERFGIGPGEASAANSLSVFAVLVSGLGTGWLLRRGLPLGLLFAVATLVQAAVWFLAPALGPWTGLAAITAYGIVSGAPPTCMFAVPGRLLGGTNAGPSAFAALMTGRNLGIFSAPIVAGWLIGAMGWSSLGWAFGVTTLVATASGVAMALAVSRNRRET